MTARNGPISLTDPLLPYALAWAWATGHSYNERWVPEARDD